VHTQWPTVVTYTTIYSGTLETRVVYFLPQLSSHGYTVVRHERSNQSINQCLVLQVLSVRPPRCVATSNACVSWWNVAAKFILIVTASV
jgi:hypothetical protein